MRLVPYAAMLATLAPIASSCQRSEQDSAKREPSVVEAARKYAILPQGRTLDSAMLARFKRNCSGITPRFKAGMSSADVDAAMDDYLKRLIDCYRGETQTSG